MEEDADFALALHLQQQFEEELREECISLSEPSPNQYTPVSSMTIKSPKRKKLLRNIQHEEHHNGQLSVVDDSWELVDPNPDIHGLFLEFNSAFFWGMLEGVEVRWSPRMTSCAGICCYEGHGGLCSVRLSIPLLKLRPRKDLVQTLLHEMIHAYLFVTDNNKDHDGHGPEFHKHMNRINKMTGANITVYHTFHDEVKLYKQHWWRCNGPCKDRKPFYGYIKRASNRAPSPNDFWWADHKKTCNGEFIKIKEPENYKSKKEKGASNEMLERRQDKRVPVNEGYTPPAKRQRFERSHSQISSAATESFSTQLRDWMTWISYPISWITTNTPILSRYFSGGKKKSREMATGESKQKTKKWKVTKKQDIENEIIPRPPIHYDDRWKSLQDSSKMRNQALSPGNPFYAQSVPPPTTVNSRNTEIEPLTQKSRPSSSLHITLRHHSGAYQASGRKTTPWVPKKPKSKRTIRSTALETVRLDEKEQYRLLINQCSQNYGSSTVVKNKGTQIESTARSINPHISAFGRENLSAESKMNLTKWLKVKDNVSEQHTRNEWRPAHRSETASIDSDLEITRVELPLKKKTARFAESPLFSSEWIQDLKRTIRIDSKDNMRQIQEQERKARLMQEKREARLSSENLKLFERVRQTTVLPESPEASDEEEDASQYPELASDMDAKVEDALRPSPPDEILVEGFQLSVTRRDMETLSGLNWLNDEIINFYMNMLMERGKMDNFPSVYAFNTFFYPKLISSGHSALRRWTRKVDIFSYNFILIPVHLGMHWCLAVIDFGQKKIQYYDSMGGQNNECLNALSSYLKEECLDKKKTDFDMNDWKSEAVKNIPHQMNGSDCGMFALKYAEYITRNSKITFTQAHMPYFRRRMVYEILMKQLL